MDPHRVLGLEPGASQAEVKRAYRRLAKALHPDAAGEGALPAFLALQEAYERLTGTKVRTVRPPSGGGGAAGGQAARPGAASEPFKEPWRADPARARAAREQARTRRRWTGGQPDPPGGTATGRSTAGESPAGRASSGRASKPGGEARARSGPGSTTSGATGPEAASGRERTDGRTGGRRRSTRKATLGSTSYDEARDAADPSWGGASWYGPTTGEYWIVNPREYADPRKHGPGYTSRGRPGSGDPPDGSVPDGEGASPPVEAERSAPAAGRRWADGRAASHEPARSTAAAWTTPRRGSSPAAQGGIDTVLGSLGRSSPTDPIRRLGLVLLAWPPLGIAAAAVIGDVTGCATYSTACEGADRLLPWLAQALLLGILLLAPVVARVLAAGTIAVLLALLPGAAVITALGGAGSAEGPPVLAGGLVLAWAAGVVWGVNRAVRGTPAREAPS